MKIWEVRWDENEKDLSVHENGLPEEPLDSESIVEEADFRQGQVLLKRFSIVEEKVEANSWDSKTPGHKRNGGDTEPYPIFRGEANNFEVRKEP